MIIGVVLLAAGLLLVARARVRAPSGAPPLPEPGADLKREYARTDMSTAELERRLDEMYGIGQDRRWFDWTDVQPS